MRAIKPSMSSNCGAILPSTFISPAFWAVGIKRAPGINNERRRFQSRFRPTGPEITSYAVVMMASIEATSAGLATDFDIGAICVKASLIYNSRFAKVDRAVPCSMLINAAKPLKFQHRPRKAFGADPPKTSKTFFAALHRAVRKHCACLEHVRVAPQSRRSRTIHARGQQHSVVLRW